MAKQLNENEYLGFQVKFDADGKNNIVAFSNADMCQTDIEWLFGDVQIQSKTNAEKITDMGEELYLFSGKSSFRYIEETVDNFCEILPLLSQLQALFCFIVSSKGKRITQASLTLGLSTIVPLLWKTAVISIC